ncbi:MAG: hypothetical protein AAF414_19125 [Pseudomonadota bacterium]
MTQGAISTHQTDTAKTNDDRWNADPHSSHQTDDQTMDTLSNDLDWVEAAGMAALGGWPCYWPYWPEK